MDRMALLDPTILTLTLVAKVLLTPVVIILVVLSVNAARGIFSRFVKHAALRDVRGPMRSSIIAGNLHELYDTGGLPYLEGLSAYGGVSKVHGLFGVRRP